MTLFANCKNLLFNCNQAPFNYCTLNVFYHLNKDFKQEIPVSTTYFPISKHIMEKLYLIFSV